jgi:hypothetical protein
MKLNGLDKWLVIPMAVKRASAFISARVGQRDLVLAFEVHAIYKTALAA